MIGKCLVCRKETKHLITQYVVKEWCTNKDCPRYEEE